LECPIAFAPRGDDWESVAVFNPSAFYKDGKIHLYYRAVGEYYPYTSRLGYAVFDEDLNLLERELIPAMIPDAKMWERSLEDPRVSEIDGDIYLTYVATPTPSPPGAVRKRLGIPMPELSAHPRTSFSNLDSSMLGAVQYSMPSEPASFSSEPHDKNIAHSVIEISPVVKLLII